MPRPPARRSLTPWLLAGGALLVAAGGGLVFFLGGDDAETVAPAGAGSASATAETPAALAARLADSPVKVINGPIHTVYHAEAALPTSAKPRADGKPTLVWFSGVT